MVRRATLAVVVLLLLSSSVVAATPKKTASKKAAAKTASVNALKGFRLLQNAAIPLCPSTPNGQELQNPPEITANSNRVLSTTLAVYPVVRTVPVLSAPFGKTEPWTCVEQKFPLQLFRNPVTGAIGYPGPTLRVRRASYGYPGDRINVLLENHLVPNTSETCIWQGSGCPGCTTLPPSQRPMCCSMTTKPTGMECFHGLNDTNLHFHGLHVSPQEPQDWVLLQLQPIGTIPGPKTTPMGDPGTVKIGTFQYAVNPLPSNQAEGTHWYHPHKHGATSLQVGSGMAGAVIVEGPFDDWLASFYKGHLAEKVMVVQQIHDLNFNSTLTVATSQITSTALPLINGQLAPKITMNPGEVQRWRLVGATIEADAQLEIDFDGLAPSGNSMRVMQIAMDGVQFSPNNYYCQPLTDSTPCDGAPSDQKFQLSPGNRGDFLVRADPLFAGHELAIPYRVFGAITNQGTHRHLGDKNAPRIKRHQTKAVLASLGDNVPALMTVYVCKPGIDPGCVDMSAMRFPTAEEFPPLPPFLNNIPQPARTQNVQFQVIAGTGDGPVPPGANSEFAIWVKGKNGDQPLQFDEQCAAFTEPIGSTEQWTLSQNLNQGGLPFHVFHIHTNPFQLMSTYINDKPVSYSTCPAPSGAPSFACITPIWEDSLSLPNNAANGGLPAVTPQGTAVIRQQFLDYTGAFVLHCHFLGHEDRGMMLTVQTVCPQNLTKYSATSLTQPECTFGQYLPALPNCSKMPAKMHSVPKSKK